jgi:hypothetical protein
MIGLHQRWTPRHNDLDLGGEKERCEIRRAHIFDTRQTPHQRLQTDYAIQIGALDSLVERDRNHPVRVDAYSGVTDMPKAPTHQDSAHD